MIANRLHDHQIIFAAIFLHFWWAGLLFFSEAPLGITAIHDLHESVLLAWDHPSVIGHGPHMAIIFAVVGALALWSEVRSRTDLKGVFLLSPQQVVLVLSAVSAVEAMARQSYADGVLRPFTFIAADQIVICLFALAHTVAIWQVFSVSLQVQKAWAWRR